MESELEVGAVFARIKAGNIVEKLSLVLCGRTRR